MVEFHLLSESGRHLINSRPRFRYKDKVPPVADSVRGITHILHIFESVKVSKVAKIRNRYNQVPHLTQDTNGKVTNSQ